MAAAQQWQQQHSGPAGCSSAGGPAVGHEHALPTPLFRSEYGGSPPEAADDVGPGARMQVGVATQDALAADQMRYPIGYPIG